MLRLSPDGMSRSAMNPNLVQDPQGCQNQGVFATRQVVNLIPVTRFNDAGFRGNEQMYEHVLAGPMPIWWDTCRLNQPRLELLAALQTSGVPHTNIDDANTPRFLVRATAGGNAAGQAI